MENDIIPGISRKGIALLLALPVVVTILAFASLMTTDVSDLAIGTPLVITPTAFPGSASTESAAAMEGLEAAYQEGLDAYARGDYSAAAAAFRFVLDNSTAPAATVHQSLGLALMQQGELETAVLAFEAAAELDPDNALLQYNLAAALAGLQRFGEAERAFRAALAFDPGMAEAAYGLAGIFRKTGRIEEAEKMLEKVVALDPDFTAAHLELGLLYASQTRWSQAEDALEKALNTDPASMEIQYNLGVVYAERGDERMARLVLTAVVSGDPGGEWGVRAEQALVLLGE